MRATAWLLLLVLTGCGWHLRGVTPLPAEYRVLYLQSQAGAGIDRALKLALEFNQVLLTSEALDAQATLSIAPLEIERRTLSLASTGQIGEFELNGRLLATLRRTGQDREVLIELRSRRRLTNDINNVQGTANAEVQQRAELEKDLVNKLMRRLQRLDYNQESKPIVPEDKK